MAKYSLSEIIQWTGGVLTDETTMNADPDFAGVCTDTGTCSGQPLIALRGPNFDGHDFLGKAILEGAAGLPAKGSDLDLPEMSIFTGPVVLVEIHYWLCRSLPPAIDRPCPDASWRSPAA